MTMGISSRAVRIKYDADGVGAGAAVEIARGTADSFEVSNSRIDNTAKDDLGTETAINDVGLKGCKMLVSAVLSATAQHKTLTGLAMSAGAGTSHHMFEITAVGVGTLRGLWFIDSFKWGADDASGAATFEMGLSSVGTISWTPV